MKTEIDYAGELPLDLSRRLHNYRTKLAPELLEVVPTHLFTTSKGTSKKQESVTNRLVYTLNKRLGITMTMHQFRHLSAKLMLDQFPGAFETVAQNLGHSGTRNVVRFYGGTDTRRASRNHGKLIERLRNETQKKTTGSRARKSRT